MILLASVEVGLMGCFIPGELGACLFGAGATAVTLAGAGWPDVLGIPRKLCRHLLRDPRLQRLRQKRVELVLQKDAVGGRR